MAVALDRAIIEIVADTDEFAEGLTTELRKAFKQLQAISSASLNNIEDSFDNLQRQITSGFGQALLTVSRRGAASLDEVKEAAIDVSIAMRSRLGEAIEDVSDSIVALGDTPGFEHLSDEAKELARVLRGDLRAGIERIGDDLEKIEQADSFEKIRVQVSQLARRELNLLEHGLDRVREELRAIGGDSAAFDKMTRDILGLNSALRQTGSAADKAAAGVKNFRAHTAQAQARGEGFRNGLQRTRLILTDLRFLAASAGVFLGAHLARSAIEAAGAFQQLEAGLRSYIEGVEGVQDGTALAAAEIEKIRQVALDTPFDFQELAESTRRLAAFSDATGRVGSTISETFEIARNDVLALSGLLSVLGQGSDALNPLIKAIGDVGARGRITGEEVRQFTNALPGFNVLKEISAGLEEMGIEMEGVELTASAVSAAAGDVDTLLNVLFKRIQAFPGAAAALEAQTLTLTGQMERFGEAMKFAAQDGFAPLAEALVPDAIDELGLLDEVVADLTPAVEALGTALSNLAIPGIPLVSGFLGTFGLDLAEAFETPEVAEAMRVVTEVVTDLASVIVDLIPVLADIVVALEPVAETLIEVLEAAVPVIDVIGELVEVLSEFGLLGPVVTAALTGVIGGKTLTAVTALTKALGALKAGSIGVAGVVVGITTAFGALATATTAGVLDTIFNGETVEEYRREIERLAETFEDIEDPIKRMTKAMDEFRGVTGKTVEELTTLVGEGFFDPKTLSGALNILQAGVGILNPFGTTIEEDVLNDYRALTEANQQLQEENLRSSQSLSFLRQAFGQVTDALTAEDIRAIATSLDLDLTQGTDGARAAIISLISEFGSLREALRGMGFGDQIKGFVTEIQRIEDQWRASTDAMNDHFDSLRAKSDPVFAVLDGLTKLPELREKVTDLFNNGIPETQEMGDYLALMKEIDTVFFQIKDAVSEVVATGGSLADLERLLGTQIKALGLPDNFLSGERSIDDIVRDLAMELVPELQQFVDGLGDDIDGVDFGHFITGFLDGADAANLAANAERSAKVYTDAYKAFLASERENMTTTFTVPSDGEARTAAIHAIRAFDAGIGDEPLSNWDKTIRNTLLDERGELKNDVRRSGEAIGDGFWQGIVNAIESRGQQPVITSLDAVLNTIVTFWQISSPSKVTTAIGFDVGEGFVVGLEQSMLVLSVRIKTMFEFLGEMMAKGMAEGMRKFTPEVEQAARRMSDGARRAAARQAGVRSPSRVFRELGNFLGEGMALGMRDMQGAVASAAAGMSASATQGAAGTVLPAPEMTMAKDMAKAFQKAQAASQVVTNTRSTQIDAPITVNGAGMDPGAVANRISGTIMARAGL